MTLDIVVPTFCRPARLRQCLKAIAAQEQAPDAVRVVVRSSDRSTLIAWPGIRTDHPKTQLVLVDGPGVIAAMTAGISASGAEIVAFTDDDAMPRSDWIARLEAHFRDPEVGAVGGRDLLPGQSDAAETEVGLFRSFGRIVGNHHLGAGPVRNVHFLKGVNMAFRRAALVMPRPGVLKGSGAQAHFEIFICQWARAHGWTVLYDPLLIVDHYPEERNGIDARLRPAMRSVYHSSYNELVSATAFTPLAAVACRILYSLLVGNQSAPGIVRGFAGLISKDLEVLRRVPPSFAGKLHGVVDVSAYQCGLESPNLVRTFNRL